MQKKENTWKIKKQNFKPEKNGSKINGAKKRKNGKTVDLSICILFAFILLFRFAFVFCFYFVFFKAKNNINAK